MLKLQSAKAPGCCFGMCTMLKSSVPRLAAAILKPVRISDAKQFVSMQTAWAIDVSTRKEGSATKWKLSEMSGKILAT